MTDPRPPGGEILLYQTDDGRTRVEVRIDGETAWLSLGQMAEVFQRDKSVISRHVKNVFDEGELVREATVAKYATVRREGEREIERDVEYFNLDVIISVGYRVKSHRGTQFRIWATQRLREYLVKGFALDDDRLKRAGGGNYFDVNARITAPSPPPPPACARRRSPSPHPAPAPRLGCGSRAGPRCPAWPRPR